MHGTTWTWYIEAVAAGAGGGVDGYQRPELVRQKYRIFGSLTHL